MESRIDDEERLPWLEAVDDEEAPPLVSTRKMAIGIAVVIVILAAIAAAFFTLGRSVDMASTGPELIEAPEGPYKSRPENPGGLDLGGTSETAYRTSAGEEPEGTLDTSRMDNPPRVEVADEPVPAPAPRETPARAAPEPDEPEPASAANVAARVQLGAFSSRAKAETAWALLSGNNAKLAALSKEVTSVNVNGRTLYRLRAGAPSAAAARSVCQSLTAAGETCVVVN